MLNLQIDSASLGAIQKSFDRIATDLLDNYSLIINDEVFYLTEIEFYYFKEQLHEDKTTHEHQCEVGKWRSHSQGLDISLGFGKDFDGGILLRGLNNKGKFINGPRRVLNQIFSNFYTVDNCENKFGLKKEDYPKGKTIFRTARHGLSEKSGSAFLESQYRYYCDIDKWDDKQVSQNEKNKIKINSTQI